MNEIKCPRCNQVFVVDENDYESILRQVRNHEFEKDIAEKEKSMNSLWEAKSQQQLLNKENELNVEINKKNLELLEIKKELEKAKTEIENKVKEVELSKAEEITKLKLDNEKMKIEHIKNLQSIKSENEKSLNEKRIEVTTLEGRLKALEVENENKLNTQKLMYDERLKEKDETIALYKDMKLKQSTKMVGESLEQHCEIEFNKLRTTAFMSASFGKDNDASGGSKGDYIFRDYDENGNEFISIMFEMKNENDETKTKHKNADFLKELDKDRNEKKCEYAVLVSLLEKDNELYNQGIVDVSYEYEKMYVIRPQFFIPLITLLRDAARKSITYKNELALYKKEHIDITTFEDEVEKFKADMETNYVQANKKFEGVIKEIDETIKHLEKMRENLLGVDKNIRIANDKAQKITIRKLTRGNPTMKERFDALKENKSE